MIGYNLWPQCRGGVQSWGSRIWSWELGKFHLCLGHVEVYIRGSGRRGEKGKELSEERRNLWSLRGYVSLPLVSLTLTTDLGQGRHYYTIKGIYVPGKIQKPLLLSEILFLWIKNPWSLHQSSIFLWQVPSIVPTILIGHNKHFWKEEKGSKGQKKKKVETLLKYCITA